MNAFADIVAERLRLARLNHRPLSSAHDAYGVLMEEVCEFFEEVKKKREIRDRVGMLNELLDIAVVCQRAAEDLRLLTEVQ